jgi:hypothetical protein
MARKATRQKLADEGIEDVVFVDAIPSKGSAAKSYTSILMPLLDHPGIWARIAEFDTPEQASYAQQNIKQGRIRIPYPDHVWAFAARRCDLYAVYRGQKPKGVRNAKRVR